MPTKQTQRTPPLDNKNKRIPQPNEEDIRITRKKQPQPSPLWVIFSVPNPSWLSKVFEARTRETKKGNVKCVGFEFGSFSALRFLSVCVNYGTTAPIQFLLPIYDNISRFCSPLMSPSPRHARDNWDVEIRSDRPS